VRLRPYWHTSTPASIWIEIFKRPTYGRFAGYSNFPLTALGHVCRGIRIHAIDTVQPPGIAISPIADMDAHQTFIGIPAPEAVLREAAFV
jgi:hypothetical protein